MQTRAPVGGVAAALALAGALAAVLAGCTSVPPGTTVRIAMKGEAPPPHEVIATIDTTVGTAGIPLEAPVERARAMAESAAQAAGADLVIYVGEEDISQRVGLKEPASVRLPARRFRWNLAKMKPTSEAP